MDITEIQAILQKLTNKKISQADLGRALGVDRSAINVRMKLKSEVKLSDIEKISTYYNVPKTNFIENVERDLTYVNIPVFGDVSASCGFGAVIDNETQTAVYPIASQILKHLGVSEKYCDMIFASGDSMEPAIIHGDALMVDRSKREIIDGQIYIIRYDNELMCKRLQKLPPRRIKVVSDNGKYESYTIDLSQPEIDFEIIGRVMWYSRVAR